MPLQYDLRTRTALVCGALALALAVSVLLGGRVRRANLFLAAFAADIGLWYLAQSFYGFFEAPIWQRFTMRASLSVERSTYLRMARLHCGLRNSRA